MPDAARSLYELCADGVGTLSSGQQETQISDTEAVQHRFIPCVGLSAVKSSLHRVLVLGGTTDADRVLPLSVLRPLDLDSSSNRQHQWAQPLSLRPQGNRRRDNSTCPVSRSSHTLTLMTDGNAYLIGGQKHGSGPDNGAPCKSMFALDARRSRWVAVDVPQATSKSKINREHFIGPRFAHAAVPISALPSRGGRARGGAPGVIVHGGYTSSDDEKPVNAVHAFDTRAKKWTLIPVNKGIAPKTAYHAAGIIKERWLVVHGGNCEEHNSFLEMSAEMHVFDVKEGAWYQPELHRKSDPPPSARRMHAVVRDLECEEALVFYGGQLEDSNYTSEMYRLTLVFKDGERGEGIQACWTRMPVKLPQAAEKEDFAIVGCALVASDVLGEYLVIGGRAASGSRRHPFSVLADPNRNVDHLTPRGLSNSNSKYTYGESSIPLKIRRRSASNTLSNPQALDMEVNSVPNKSAAGPRAPSPAIMEQAAAGKKKSSQARRPHQTVPEPLASPDIPELFKGGGDPNLQVEVPQAAPLKDNSNPSKAEADEATSRSSRRVKGSGLKRPRRDVSKDESPGSEPQSIPDPVAAIVTSAEPLPKSKARGGHRIVVIEETPSDQEDEPDAAANDIKKSAASRLKSAKEKPRSVHELSLDDDGAFVTPPVKKFRSLIDKGVSSRKPNGPMDSKHMGTPRAPEFIVQNSRIDMMDLIDDKNADEEAEDEIEEMPDSANSSFMTSTALANRGKALAAAKSRGRGGRGRGRGTGRGGASARASAVAKKKDAETAAIREELEDRIHDLETENAKLKSDLSESSTDNQSLNKQLEGLLNEIRELRNQNAAAKKSSTRSRSAPASVHDRAQMALDKQKDAELKNLIMKKEDLEEELAEANEAKDELIKKMKKMEMTERKQESEIQDLKNKKKDVEELKDLYQEKLEEFKRQALLACEQVKESEKKFTEMERLYFQKEQDYENLRREQSEAGSRIEKDQHQLTSSKRQVTKLVERVHEMEQANEQRKKEMEKLQDSFKATTDKLEDTEKRYQEARAEMNRLEDKNVELVAAFKTTDANYKDKLDEIAKMREDARKAHEASLEGKKTIADAKCEKTKLQRDYELAVKQAEEEKEKRKRLQQGMQLAMPRMLKGFENIMKLFPDCLGAGAGGVHAHSFLANIDGIYASAQGNNTVTENFGANSVNGNGSSERNVNSDAARADASNGLSPEKGERNAQKGGDASVDGASKSAMNGGIDRQQAQDKDFVMQDAEKAASLIDGHASKMQKESAGSMGRKVGGASGGNKENAQDKMNVEKETMENTTGRLRRKVRSVKAHVVSVANITNESDDEPEP